MRFISHRGNIRGRDPHYENAPSYVDQAISEGYDVEIDVWELGDSLYLGHDYGAHKINDTWLENREERIWVHCKNIQALTYFDSMASCLHFPYFWHENDRVALTSTNIIWAYPTISPIMSSIAVLPETMSKDVSFPNLNICAGICSDQIAKYRNYYENILR